MVKGTIGGRLADLINPIAVKEMRQAVKSKLVAWVLMLFLLVQLVVIAVVLVFSEEFDNYAPEQPPYSLCEFIEALKETVKDE